MKMAMLLDGLHGNSELIKMKTQLLCTFTTKSDIDSTIKNIKKSYDIAFESHERVRPVVISPHNVSSRHLYVIHVEDRDGFRTALTDRGVMTGLHYPVPLHLQPCYQHLGHKEGDFPNTEHSARTLLSLPIFPGMTENQVARVIETVLELA